MCHWTQLIAHCEPFLSPSVHIFPTHANLSTWTAPSECRVESDWLSAFASVGSRHCSWNWIWGHRIHSEWHYLFAPGKNALGCFMRVLLEVIHCFPFSMQAYPLLHCEPNNDGRNYNALLRLILLIYIIRVVECSNLATKIWQLHAWNPFICVFS